MLFEKKRSRYREIRLTVIMMVMALPTVAVIKNRIQSAGPTDGGVKWVSYQGKILHDCHSWKDFTPPQAEVL